MGRAEVAERVATGTAENAIRAAARIRGEKARRAQIAT